MRPGTGIITRGADVVWISEPVTSTEWLVLMVKHLDMASCPGKRLSLSYLIFYIGTDTSQTALG